MNETWQDGNCLNCVCKEDGERRPNHQCAQTTCPSVSEHPDHGDYQLEVVEVPGSCCPNVVRTACIDDYEVIEVSDYILSSKSDFPNVDHQHAIELRIMGNNTDPKDYDTHSCD